LRLYETMLLCDPRREDAEIDQTVNGFTTLVTERGGEIVNTERWGRRRLAYEIKNLTEGYYAVITYNLDPAKRQEIEQALPFLEGLVRTKTVCPEPRKRKAV
jgi:small subunit ribosomal protein S6